MASGKEGAVPLLAGWKGTKVDFALKGSKALVTGGTKGIGKSIVESLAAEGVDIALCSRNAAEVEAAVKGLQEKFGVKAFGAGVDVSDGAALKKFVDDAAAALGGLDTVVSNVSALKGGDNEEAWKECFEIDVLGAVRLRNASVPHLLKSKNPSFIAISSVSGLEIDGFYEGYGAMKAALNFFIKGSARTYAKDGIRFNIVSPGNVYFAPGIWATIEQHMPEMFAGALAGNPSGRMGTPQEMAAATVFFASPVSAFCTGSNLIVDGAVTKLAP
ncbi:short-chain dehydrogenase/reductase SDR [Hyaloraphidium curvatum]|nr:short-chain dehydrogenase/reductase SDR [Hyaloraphidium curvatum]